MTGTSHMLLMEQTPLSPPSASTTHGADHQVHADAPSSTQTAEPSQGEALQSLLLTPTSSAEETPEGSASNMQQVSLTD